MSQLTRTPRFLTVTNDTATLDNYKTASFNNTGTGAATVTNTRGEVMVVDAGEVITITSPDPARVNDILQIDTATNNTTLKIVYYE